MTLFYLNYFLKGLVSKCNRSVRNRQLGLQHLNCDAMQFSSWGNLRENIHLSWPTPFISHLALKSLAQVTYPLLLTTLEFLGVCSSSFARHLSLWLMSTLQAHFPINLDYGSVKKFSKKIQEFFFTWDVLKCIMTLFLHLINFMGCKDYLGFFFCINLKTEYLRNHLNSAFNSQTYFK